MQSYAVGFQGLGVALVFVLTGVVGEPESLAVEDLVLRGMTTGLTDEEDGDCGAAALTSALTVDCDVECDDCGVDVDCVDCGVGKLSAKPSVVEVTSPHSARVGRARPSSSSD